MLSFLAHFRKRLYSVQVSMLVYLTMIQYFYRTTHRERFSSLQFGKAFLGFTEYNYWLHGGLVLMNTYAPHIICFMMLPWVEESLRDPKRDKVEEEEESQVHESNISCKKISLQLVFFAFTLNACSCIMVMVTKRELMFPQRTAPKYVYDVAQTTLFLVMTVITTCKTPSKPEVVKKN